MIYYVDYAGEKVSRREYCKRKGLCYNTVKQRMKLHNETFEQAVQYYDENGTEQRLIDYNGEKISQRKYCEKKGLNYNTVQQRMQKHNETFEQSVNFYEKNGVNPPCQLVDCNGELVSAKECCRRKNIDYSKVQRRVYKYNETYEQAIKYLETHFEILCKPKIIIKDKRFYDIWRNMVDRCTNPKNIAFEKYSKLGVQESWLDFENFQEDMYEEYLDYVDTHKDLPSIDRKKNSIGYFKENCHWIPRSMQNRNQDRNIWINENELLIEYCERKNLRYDIMRHRIQAGYTLEEAESIPIPKYNGKNLKYINKNIREFNIICLDNICPSNAVCKCNICGKKIKLRIHELFNNKSNKGCFCRKGRKYLIGNNNYILKELDTIYSYTHKQIKEAIANNDMSLFGDIVNLSYEEWIELLKDIHSKW